MVWFLRHTIANSHSLSLDSKELLMLSMTQKDLVGFSKRKLKTQRWEIICSKPDQLDLSYNVMSTFIPLLTIPQFQSQIQGRVPRIDMSLICILKMFCPSLQLSVERIRSKNTFSLMAASMLPVEIHITHLRVPS